MNLKQLDHLYDQAVQKMNSGDFGGALEITRIMQSLGSDYHMSYVASALLIDIGSALGEQQITKEGIELLEKDLEVIVQHEKRAPSAYYNLANGYYSLFSVELRENLNTACFRSTELDKAKFYFKKVLEYELQDKGNTTNTLVNLGNCFDHLGRTYDALECYEKALELEPEHGMALGNRGIALCFYSDLASEHREIILLEAYDSLSRALKSGVHIEAKKAFKDYLERIVPGGKILEKSLEYPGFEIRAKHDFEKYLVEFCLENRLYLSLCSFCQKCAASIGDSATIEKMIVGIDRTREGKYPEDNPFLSLSAYLNQIKQDYITARFLLILSRYKGLDLDFVDRKVRIVNTLDYRMYNIYIELMKASFKSFYDILDKIACFINDYCKLQMKPDKVSFCGIWYASRKNKEIREEIKNTGNLSLNALFDISKDIESGPYESLRRTRNAFTHRFVSIRMFQDKEDEENMTEDTLFRRTLELAQLVRNAIMYLLHFVDIEENKKEERVQGVLPSLFAQELPDRLKSQRMKTKEREKK